jgi:hypothetical protein
MNQLYSNQYPIKNIFNVNSFNLLDLISKYPGKSARIKFYLKGRKKLSKTQFYRYLKSLKENRLITIKGWVKNRHTSGHIYELTKRGKKLLRDLQKSEIKKLIK